MKLITSLIIVALIITPCYQKCSTKTDNVTIFPATQEILTWNLVEEFFNGAGLTYSLSDTQQTIFQIIDPVENTGGSSLYSEDATQIISSRALTSNKFWINQFAYLNKGADSYTLAKAQGELGQQTIAPKFDEIIKIADIKNGLQCHDFEFYDENTFLIDCSSQEGKKYYNTIYYINNEDSFEYLKEEALIQQHQGRILGQYKQNGINGQEYRYLVRTTPSYSISNDGSLSGDSLLEIFQLNNKGQPINTGYVLDSITMSQILDVSSDLEFNIVDMKVLENGDIYILDAQYGIYIINYIPNGTFQLKKWIDTGMNFAYAFDRNIYIRRDGQYSENIVILGYGFIELIVDGKQTQIYTLPSQLPYTFPSNIDLSQEFVVVRQSNSTFIFDIDAKSTELLSVQTIADTKYALINPFLPDMIILTLQRAYRYTLSQGYLKYKGPTTTQEQQTIDIIAKSDDQECKVTIKYQILKSDDKQLYKYNDIIELLPQQVTEDVEPLQLNTLTSGPNEQYRFAEQQLNEDETSVNININAFWELNFTTPLSKELKFSDVLVGKQSNYFFIAEQNNDGKLTILKAHHDSIYKSDATKEKLFEIANIGQTLKKTTFQMWECECPKFHFAYVENNKVILKVFNNVNVVDIATIQFDTQNISILFLENFLFVLQNNLVSAYTEHGEFVKTIDLNILQSQGYTGTWNPLQIYGNRKIRENLLFVVNKDHIVILDFHTSFTFIKQIQIDESDNIELAIGSQTFFIINNNEIIEYNHDRLNNIFKTKAIELYNYELITPLLGDFCSDTGYLFVVAKLVNTPVEINDETIKYNLLVFQPNTLQHDTLFKAIELQNQPQLISSQGTKEQMYVYIQTTAESVIYSLLSNPVLIIQPSINNPSFETDLKVNLEIFNYDDQQSIKLQQTVKVINTQTKIYVDNKEFKNSLTITTDVKVTKQDLGATWFTGQVTEFSINCEQCGKDKGIEINQIVQITNTQLLKDYSIKSINGNIVQAKNAIFKIKDDDTLDNTILNYDFTTDQYSCYQSTYNNNDYLLSLCYDGETYTIYAVSGLSITGWYPIGEVLKLSTTVKKIQLLDNDLLVILDSESLIISQINMNEDDWVLEEQIVLNLEQLQIQFEDLLTFTPNDFLITAVNVANTKQYYKLILTSAEGLFIQDFYFSDQNQPIISVNLEHINLTAELLKIKQFATTTTQYLQIKQITQFKDNSFNLFIQTNNVVHYGIKITFTQKEGNDYLIYSKIEAKFTLNRYGTWKTINNVAISDKYIAIPYQNQENIVVTVYQVSENIKPTTIIGSYRFTYDVNAFNPLDFGLFFRNDKLYGSSPDSPINLYQINDQPSLVISQTKELPIKTQDITITAKNDFNKVDSKFTLTVSDPGPGPNPPGPDPVDPDEPSDSSNLWWILLVSIGGGLIILGGIGYMVYRSKKSQSSVDDYGQM